MYDTAFVTFGWWEQNVIGRDGLRSETTWNSSINIGWWNKLKLNSHALEIYISECDINFTGISFVLNSCDCGWMNANLTLVISFLIEILLSLHPNNTKGRLGWNERRSRFVLIIAPDEPDCYWPLLRGMSVCPNAKFPQRSPFNAKSRLADVYLFQFMRSDGPGDLSPGFLALSVSLSLSLPLVQRLSINPV